MNFKRYAIAALAAFVFIFLYELFLHGYLLLTTYESTPNVWRNFAEMDADWPYAMLFKLALGAWTAFAFTQMYPEGGVKNGLVFGLLIGVFSGILISQWYLWLPVSMNLVWIWFFGSVIEGLVAGLIVGLIYHK